MLLLVALPFGLVAVAAVGVVGPVIVLPLALWQVGRSTGLPTHVLLRQAAAVLSVVSAVSMITALTVRAMESLPDPIVILTAACVQAVGLTLAQVVPSVRRQTKQVRRALTLLRSPATDAPRK